MAQASFHPDTQLSNQLPSLLDNRMPPRPARGRDQIPLPDAAKRIIRDQRGTGHASLVRHIHKLRSNGLMPFRPARRSSRAAPEPQPDDTDAAVPARRLPTLQEMYNTWRALEEQVNKIRRLPLYIKAERQFCHSCRILKIKVRNTMRLPSTDTFDGTGANSSRRQCECFDYSELEEVFLETDKEVKLAALHQLPFQRDIEMADHEPSDAQYGADATAAQQHHVWLAVDRDNTNSGASAEGGAAVEPSSWVSLEALPMGMNLTEIDENGRRFSEVIADAHNATTHDSFDFNAPVAPDGNVTAVVRSNADGPAAGTAATVAAPATALHKAPTLIKFEIRPVIIAKEKIGANARRWRCQFGSSPSNNGGPVCTREDDNLETIRRHYGREHGRHRYHKKPVIHTLCSRCRYDIGKRHPPAACPSCHVARCIWLREMFALIEVPVPLCGDGIQGGGADSGATAAIATAGDAGAQWSARQGTPGDAATPAAAVSAMSPAATATAQATPMPLSPAVPATRDVPASPGVHVVPFRPAADNVPAAAIPTLNIVAAPDAAQTFQGGYIGLDGMPIQGGGCLTYPMTPMTPMTPLSPYTPTSPESAITNSFDAESLAMASPFGHGFELVDAYNRALLATAANGFPMSTTTTTTGTGVGSGGLSYDVLAQLQLLTGLPSTVRLADIQLQQSEPAMTGCEMPNSETDGQMHRGTSATPQPMYGII